MNSRRGRSHQDPRVSTLLQRLNLVLVDLIVIDGRQRYFRAKVAKKSGAQFGFLKVALAKDVSLLLRREIEVLLWLNEMSAPSVQVYSHSLDSGDEDFAFGLFEFLETSGDSGFAQKTGEDVTVDRVRAVVEAIHVMQSLPIGLSGRRSLVLRELDIEHDQWVVKIQTALDIVVPAMHGMERKGPQLKDALVNEVGDNFVDRLLAFVTSLASNFRDDGSGFLVHGDCAPSNTYWRKDGRAIFVDWEWSGIASSPVSLPFRSLDLANFIARCWWNVALVPKLLDVYLRRGSDHEARWLSLRIALIDQTLNKLGPIYSYTEQDWTEREGPKRFEAARYLLQLALSESPPDANHL